MSRHGGPRDWGLVLGARAVGLLLRSVLMYRLVVRYYLRITIVASVVAAVPLLGLGFGLSAPYLIVAAIIGGVGSSASAISWDTALHEHIPRDKLSRVASIDDLLSYAAIPLGQLAAGPVAGVFRARPVCLVSAMVWAAATVVPLLNRSVRSLQRWQPTATSGPAAKPRSTPPKTPPTSSSERTRLARRPCRYEWMPATKG